MRKNYQKWMPIKAKIHNSKNRIAGYHEGEIWICNLGDNIGFEEDGKNQDFTRPVLVLKIYNRDFCHVLPLSTTSKRGRFWFEFDGKTGKQSVALLSQSRAIDSARLRDKIGRADRKTLMEIKKRVCDLLW